MTGVNVFLKLMMGSGVLKNGTDLRIEIIIHSLQKIRKRKGERPDELLTDILYSFVIEAPIHT